MRKERAENDKTSVEFLLATFIACVVLVFTFYTLLRYVAKKLQWYWRRSWEEDRQTTYLNTTLSAQSTVMR